MHIFMVSYFRCDFCIFFFLVWTKISTIALTVLVLMEELAWMELTNIAVIVLWGSLGITVTLVRHKKRQLTD